MVFIFYSRSATPRHSAASKSGCPKHTERTSNLSPRIEPRPTASPSCTAWPLDFFHQLVDLLHVLFVLQRDPIGLVGNKKGHCPLLREINRLKPVLREIHAF